jgi:signal transduction histidine kinase
VAAPFQRSTRRRLQAALIAGAAALLGVLTVHLRHVTDEIGQEMSNALTEQRVHIERASEIERLARITHIELVDRWLLPYAGRAQRQRDVEDAVTSVRRAAQEYARLTLVDADEGPIVQQLLVAVAIWSNQVNQAVVAANGPEAATELRKRLDEVGRLSTQLIDLASRMGSSTDRRLQLLRDRQAKLATVFVMLALAIAGAAVFGIFRLSHADVRVERAESARVREAEEAHQRAQLYASMSNELKRPLVAVAGMAAQLAERRGDGTTRETAQHIERDARDLLAIIDDILDTSKVASEQLQLRLEPISLADVLARCLTRCEGLLAGKRVQVRCEVDPDLPRVHGDFVKLHQACTHLVGNAIKVTDEGQIIVRARRVAGQVVIAVEEPSGSANTMAIAVARTQLAS